jgi:rubrerythrin
MACMIFHLFNKIRKTQDQKIEDEPVQEKQIVVEKPTHCSNCGVDLEEIENLQYCPYCGISL